MSLPIEWTEKIFKKLSLAYGRDFLGRYEGLPLADVKTDWSHELSGFEAHPEAIKHALQNLHPSKPPTVYEFREWCAKAPKMAALELPLPPQDPAIVAAIVSRIKGADHVPAGMRDWAHRLKARHDGGDRLTRYQVDGYRQALGLGA